MQSKTQGLNITEQLNAGIRFIDFRVVYTSPPNESSTAQHDWYCLHLVQSRQPGVYSAQLHEDTLVTILSPSHALLLVMWQRWCT